MQAHPPQGDLFVSNVETQLVDRVRRRQRSCRKPVDRLAIISDVGPRVCMDSFATRVSSMSTTNMSLTCIQPGSTSLGGIPGRLRTFQASRQVTTIWICEECHIQKIPAKKWGDTEIAERGRSVLVMSARYRSAGLIPHQRGWTDAG